MKSCDTCEWFVRLKNLKGWQGRIGICEYEDGSLARVVKNCQNHKGKKYVRPKKLRTTDAMQNLSTDFA
jgi:hypothetical protein